MFTVNFVIFNLSSCNDYGDFGWLGVRYILSELKKLKGIMLFVDIIDEKNWEEALSKLLEKKPHLIGIPAIQQNLKLIQKFCYEVKRLNPITVSYTHLDVYKRQPDYSLH